MNLKKAIKTFNGMSWLTKVQLLFYPIYFLWRMPIAWAKSLWEARILLNGQWHRYMGFHPKNAINSLFYQTQWINLDRYGRQGVSPILGLGAYPLKNWLHLSRFASYIYANAGAVTTLVGTLFWVLSHLVWIGQVDTWWLLAITVLLFFSTTAYAMAFAIQNYQILGWMWLPLALYSLSFELWIVASIIFLAAGMAGITPIFFAVPIMVAISFMTDSWTPILVIIPALLLTVSRFLPLLRDGGLASAVTNIAKMIGMTAHKVRYKREMNRLNKFTLYFFGLYLGSSFIFWHLSGELPILLFLGAGLFLFNMRFFRVADMQSVIILNVTLWVVTILNTEPDWWSVCLFWLVSSPFGSFLSIQKRNINNAGFNVIVNKPFDNQNILSKITEFFSTIGVNEKVYFAYTDPGGEYNNIFDGYRVIHEAPLVVAAQKQFHLFPDWWSVSETNYEGAPNCWGRSFEEVKENCILWDASYTVIYQESDSSLNNIWLDEFELINELDWADLIPNSQNLKLWPEDNPIPKWFLLRRIEIK